MSLNNKNSLIAQVQNQYGVGPVFATMFLEQWLNTKNLTEEQFHQSIQTPTAKMWFDFAITTNERGRYLAKLIQPFLDANATRYLDAGCGYGGFLIGFHELGLDVFGFDLDPRLVAYSKASLKDFNLPEEKAQVGDLLDSQLIARLGKFDAITCNDVLEHVNDVTQAMEHLIEMLAPHGVLTVQVPNKDFIGFISHDSHYYLFGLTLLKHDDAREFFQHFFDQNYDVGEYYGLDFYVKKLKSLGCDITVLTLSQKSKKEGLRLIFQSMADFFQFLVKTKLPGKIKFKVFLNYCLYLPSLGFHGALALLSNREKIRFKQRYLSDSWAIVAVKK
jgi:2-polyprenyl-3-methyl-5-hydroxy-6-metoxy-1,4-benzoquinol methylase